MKRVWIPVLISFLLLFLVGCRQHCENDITFLVPNKAIVQEDDEQVDETVQTECIEMRTLYDADLSPFSGENWQEAYQKILFCDPRSYCIVADPNTRMEDRWIYLGVHDFDNDDIPELIIGDGFSVSIFTFVDGTAQKLADLCIPDTVWCINGLFFNGNCIGTQCNGAGGSDFVNFGFLNGEYVLGIYTELNNEYNPPIINGESATLEQMNRIYPTSYDAISMDDLKEQIRLTYEDENWVIYFQSGEPLVLDEQFDFERFLWN